MELVSSCITWQLSRSLIELWIGHVRIPSSLSSSITCILVVVFFLFLLLFFFFFLNESLSHRFKKKKKKPSSSIMLLEPFHQPHHRFFSLRFCAFSSASTFQCRICNRSKSMISVFYQPWTSSAFWFPLPYVPARTMVLRLKSWPMNVASPASPTLEVKPESNIVFIDFVSLCTPHNGCILLAGRAMQWTTHVPSSISMPMWRVSPSKELNIEAPFWHELAYAEYSFDHGTSSHEFHLIMIYQICLKHPYYLSSLFPSSKVSATTPSLPQKQAVAHYRTKLHG